MTIIHLESLVLIEIKDHLLDVGIMMTLNIINIGIQLDMKQHLGVWIFSKIQQDGYQDMVNKMTMEKRVFQINHLIL